MIRQGYSITEFCNKVFPSRKERGVQRPYMYVQKAERAQISPLNKIPCGFGPKIIPLSRKNLEKKNQLKRSL